MGITTDREIARLALGLQPATGFRIVSDGPIDRTKPTVEVLLGAVGESTDGSLHGFHSDPPLSLQSSDLASWHGYDFDLYGLMVPDLPVECPWPFWRLFDPNGDRREIIIQLWRQRAHYKDSPVYAELLTLPGFPERESIQILGKHGEADLARADHGLALLRQVERSRREEEHREEARTRLRTIVQNLVAEDTLVSRPSISAKTFLTLEGVDKLTTRAGWKMNYLKALWSEYKKVQVLR